MIPTFSMGQVGFGGRSLVAPTSSYANAGGTGNRTAGIVFTAQVAGSPIATEQPINGGFGDNTGDSYSLFAGINFVAGDHFTCDFGAGVKKFIDEMKSYHSATIAWGNWKFRWSDDGAAWNDLNTFAWSGVNGATFAVTGMPAEGARHFRIEKVGSTTGTQCYFREIEFKIAPGAL